MHGLLLLFDSLRSENKTEVDRTVHFHPFNANKVFMEVDI